MEQDRSAAAAIPERLQRSLRLSRRPDRHSWGLSQWQLLMAASVISVLPVAILFFVAQRFLIQGVVFTGVK